MIKFKKKYRAPALCLLVSLFSCIQAVNPVDVNIDLMEKKGAQIYKITPTLNPRRGGTGFSVRAKSGRTVTVTNSHVCDSSVDGYMDAWRDGSDRPHHLKILEISELTDLCVLEGVPSDEGSKLASSIPKRERLYTIGHPLLEPNAITSGYLTGREAIEIVDEGRDQEHCTGYKRIWREVNTVFGPMSACIVITDAMNTTIEIFPGNSGSPVFASNGSVVGVMFASNNNTHRGAFVPLSALADFLSAY